MIRCMKDPLRGQYKQKISDSQVFSEGRKKCSRRGAKSAKKKFETGSRIKCGMTHKDCSTIMGT